MPKKKLTKAQVKRKLKTIANNAYDLAVDILANTTQSHVPMSFAKIQEINDKARNALNRMK